MAVQNQASTEVNHPGRLHPPHDPDHQAAGGNSKGGGDRSMDREAVAEEFGKGIDHEVVKDPVDIGVFRLLR